MSEKIPPGVREYVIEHIKRGENNNQIAEATGLSWHTVQAIREEVQGGDAPSPANRKEKAEPEPPQPEPRIPPDTWKTCYTLFEEGKDVVATVIETGLPADIVRGIHEDYSRDRGTPRPADLAKRFSQLKEETEKAIKQIQEEVKAQNAEIEKLRNFVWDTLQHVQDVVNKNEHYRFREMLESLF